MLAPVAMTRRTWVLPYAGLTIALPLLLAGALVVAGKASAVQLTRDLAAQAGVDPWWGFLGFVGVLYLAAAVGVCGFTALVSKANSAQESISVRGFLLVTAALLSLLALDDLFMVHEEVAPILLHLPERVVIATYGLAAVGYIVVFRRFYVGGARVLGVAALLCLAVSVALDSLTGGGAMSTVIEDVFKFVGFSLVLVTMTVMCLRMVRRSLAADGWWDGSSPSGLHAIASDGSGGIEAVGDGGTT